MTRTTKAQRERKMEAERNGAGPELISLELDGNELQLMHNVLVNAQWPSVIAKQVAASVQAKIEALVPTE